MSDTLCDMDGQCTTPLLSVIVPCYENGRQIGGLIESLNLAVNGNAVEVIIVDDGSEDDSLTLAEAALSNAPHWETIRFEQNSGASVVRNAGLELATCDWVMFADADDMLPPGAVRLLIDKIRCGLDCDILVGDHCLLEDGRLVLHEGINTDEGMITARKDLDILVSMCLSRRGFHGKRNVGLLGGVLAKIYRKAFLLENDLRYDPSLRRCQDVEFNVRAFMRATRVEYIRAPLYVYAIHPDSTCHKIDEQVQNKIAIFLKTIADDLRLDIDQTFAIDYDLRAITEVRYIWSNAGARNVNSLKRICKSSPFRDSSERLLRQRICFRDWAKALLIAHGPYAVLAAVFRTI